MTLTAWLAPTRSRVSWALGKRRPYSLAPCASAHQRKQLAQHLRKRRLAARFSQDNDLVLGNGAIRTLGYTRLPTSFTDATDAAGLRSVTPQICHSIFASILIDQDTVISPDTRARYAAARAGQRLSRDRLSRARRRTRRPSSIAASFDKRVGTLPQVDRAGHVGVAVNEQERDLVQALAAEQRAASRRCAGGCATTGSRRAGQRLHRLEHQARAMPSRSARRQELTPSSGRAAAPEADLPVTERSPCALREDEIRRQSH